jgi:hypothetical protein
MSKRQGTGRRAFLRGAGGFLLALPGLELTHGEAWAQATGAAKRFITFFRHGGTATNMPRGAIDRLLRRYDGSGAPQGANLWNPTDPSANLVLGPIHSILSAHRSKLLVVTGVDNAAGILQAPYLGGHRWANSTILTAARAVETTTSTGREAVLAQGPSIDHVLETRLQSKSPTPFSSVRVKVLGHDYGTPFFSGANKPIGSHANPAKAFDAYFAGVTPGAPSPELLRRRAANISVLEGVTEGYRRLAPKLSSQDRQVVDAHLTHLGELEGRVRALNAISCTPPTFNRTTTDRDAERVGPIMVDIALAALRCGLTNVATVEVSDIITSWLPQPWGPLDLGHTLHHLARDVGATGPYAAKRQQWLDEMQLNRQWCMGLFRRFLQGLDSVPEGNGSMLDNSLMLYTSEFSNGSVHSINDVPLLLAGSAGGHFRTGRHINCNVANPTDRLAYQTRTGTHNLYTSILNAFGFPDAHFGADLPGLAFKGPLPGLT